MELSAFPAVTQYTWRKDGTVIDPDNDDGITLRPDGMIFSSVSRADGGVYTVEITDEVLATITLIVYRKLIAEILY